MPTEVSVGEGEGVGVRADCCRVTSSETGLKRKMTRGETDGRVRKYSNAGYRSPTPALTVGRRGSLEPPGASPR